MFPRSFLFFIFIMVIDLVLKSAKDKKKIEQSRKKKIEELNKPFPKRKDRIKGHKEKIKPITKVKVEKETTKDKVKSHIGSLEMKAWEEPLFDEGQNQNAEFIKYDKIEEKKTKKLNNSIKDDILRGIIYSEILSEPKSLKKKRSM